MLAMLPTVGRAEIRPLSTDRPDRTESPYSVPARWFQFETDLVSHGRIEDESEVLTGTSALSFNAKYGLTPRMDVQFIFTPWLRSELERPGLPGEAESGTGQLGVRLKRNLWGNDSGETAMALIPFAIVPTHGADPIDIVTWGLLAPVAFDIGNDRALSVMGGFTRIDNDEMWWIASASLGTPIAGNLSGFLELYVSRGGFERDAVDDVTIDAGFTYAAGEKWQFDAGAYLGTTSHTEDWRVFLGAATRFSLRSDQ